MYIFILKPLIIIIIVPLLISVAYFILAERKIMGSIQGCYSPNTLGGWSLAQFLLNFFIKKVTLSKLFHESIFFFSPSFIFLLHFMTGGDLFCNPNVGVLFFSTLLTLTIHGLFLANWSNNFKSPFLVFFGVLLVNVILCILSFDFAESLLVVNGMPRLYLFYPLLLFVPSQDDDDVCH